MPYADPEKQKKARHESYLRNKQRILGRQRQWRVDNPERKRETDTLWGRMYRQTEKGKERIRDSGYRYRYGEFAEAAKLIFDLKKQLREK